MVVRKWPWKFFPQSKREFSTKPLLLPAWHVNARFPLGSGPGTNTFLYHQTKAYEQYHVKQIKIRLSKWLNNHPHGHLGTLICTSKQRVFDLCIMTIWLSAFWYCNPIIFNFPIVLPYGNIQSVPQLKFLSFSKKTTILKRFCFLWYFPLSFYLSLFNNLFNFPQRYV